MGKMIDSKFHGVLSDRLARAYQDSFYKRMKDAGAYSGSTLQEAREIHHSITSATIHPELEPIKNFMSNGSRIWQNFINPVNQTLRAVQEAPNFAWAYKTGRGATKTKRPTIKNRPMSDAEIAMRMNDYTGDPSTRGFIWTQNQGKRELLNYHHPSEI